VLRACIAPNAARTFTPGLQEKCVLPVDANGKVVVPFDEQGLPLIELEADGVTPIDMDAEYMKVGVL